MATKKAPTVSIVDSKEIEVYKKQVTQAEKFGLSLEVKSDSDYQEALVEGKHIKEQLEMIISRKEEITKPLNTALKSVRELFKPLEAKAEGALLAIKAKMLSYSTEKERKAQEDKRKLAERVERGTMTAETAIRKIEAIVEPQKTVVTNAGSATTKTVKKWRVIDKSKVPLDFMEVDMVKVRASFRAGTPVAGIEEYEEKELAFGN